MHQIYNDYQHIMPMPDTWHARCASPLPQTIWVNTQRIAVSDCRALLEQAGFELTPMSWCDHGFRVKGKGLGKLWAFRIGLFHIQEEVSMMPVSCLEPQPGELVLDLCAAPGNKTAQIALAMQQQGMVVANDRQFQRMRAFGQIAKRLGLSNVSTCIYDGRHFPNCAQLFDRVLVDAPCSGEGTFRKGRGRDITPCERNSRRLQAIQIGLLKKAVRLCRPGGRIVYSTCTFSPIENEQVLTTILNRFGDELHIEPIQFPGLTATPGLTSWGGAPCHPEVTKAVRIWPHLNDTGGFFIAVLRRSDQAFVSSDHHNHEARYDCAVGGIVDALVTRFDFSKDLTRIFDFSKSTGRGVYMRPKSAACPAEVGYDSEGLFCIKTNMQHPKLTTGAAFAIGHLARKNTVTVTAVQRDQYLAMEDVMLSTMQIDQATPGYVLVKHCGYVLGVGLYISDTVGGQIILRSLFPKAL